jgi:hypothetical protein
MTQRGVCVMCARVCVCVCVGEYSLVISVVVC